MRRPTESTGDERVDAAMVGLAELAEAPLPRHPEIFEDVHRGLAEVLAGVDEAGE